MNFDIITLTDMLKTSPTSSYSVNVNVWTKFHVSQ